MIIEGWEMQVVTLKTKIWKREEMKNTDMGEDIIQKKKLVGGNSLLNND